MCHLLQIFFTSPMLNSTKNFDKKVILNIWLTCKKEIPILVIIHNGAMLLYVACHSLSFTLFSKVKLCSIYMFSYRILIHSCIAMYCMIVLQHRLYSNLTFPFEVCASLNRPINSYLLYQRCTSINNKLLAPCSDNAGCSRGVVSL